MTQPNYPGAPSGGGGIDGWDALRRWIVALVAVINRMNTGKINCTGEVALTSGATSTAVIDARATAFSYIGLAPKSAAAAGAIATTFPSTRTNGRFTLTHANATTTREFVYTIQG